MRTVTQIFLSFVLIVTMAIPLSFQWSNDAFAKTPIKDKDGNKIEVKDETFDNNHISKSWTSTGDNVKLELWFDLKAWNDQSSEEKSTMKIKLQKYDKKKKKYVDTGQEAKRKAQDKNKKQKNITFKNLKKGTTYRLFFDGYNFIWPTRNRVSYNLSVAPTETDKYKLTTKYDYKYGSKDTLSFTINPASGDEDHDYHFNGKVKYTVKKHDAKAKTFEKKVSSNKSKTIKLDKFEDNKILDDYFSPEGEKGDKAAQTKIDVTYTGKIDNSTHEYILTEKVEIQRNKSKISELNISESNGKIHISSKVALGDAVKKPNWKIQLLEKGSNDEMTDPKKPTDQEKNVNTSFSRKDFGSHDTAKVKVTFTGKATYGNKIILYRATKEESVNKPKEPVDHDSGGENNDGNHDKNKDDNKKDEKPKEKKPKENKDAHIDLTTKALDNHQVEIKATLQKVNEPTGTWKIIFNGQENTYKDEEETITKTISTKEIEAEEIKVTTQFKGKDKKGKINVKKSETVSLQTSAEPEENTAAKISMTPTILEKNQVEIQAILENAEEPHGTWSLTFHEEGTMTFKNRGDSMKQIFNTESITENEVSVTAKFVGKDQDGKKIEQELTEQITIQNNSTPDEDSEKDSTSNENDEQDSNRNGDQNAGEDHNQNENIQSDEEVAVEQIITTPQAPSGQIGGPLPKTATPYGYGLIAGSLFFLLGGAIFFWRRRHA